MLVVSCRDEVNSTRLNKLAAKTRKPQKTWSFTSTPSFTVASPNGTPRKLSVTSTDVSEMDIDHLYSELGLKPIFSAARTALDGVYEEELSTQKGPKPDNRLWWAVKGVSYFVMSFASILIMFYLLRL